MKLAYTVLFLFSLNNSFALESSEILSETIDIGNTGEYWTPERIQNAKPIQTSKLPEVLEPEHPSSGHGEEVSSNGAPPTINRAFLQQEDTTKISINKGVENHSKSVVMDEGLLKMLFSSSRLVPAEANTVYPYLTIGRLFFTIPNQGDFTCSASVLRKRIIFTAGHCVHSGTNGQNGYYTNFMFIPAYLNGKAPVRRWFANYVAVHAEWANGGGVIPNEADYGMLEMKDQKGHKISAYTGYLGYRTQALNRNHTHLLGYACNFDSCQQMHQVTGETGRSVTAKNVEYGSDMREGSDGSTWVQNLGVQGMGEEPGPNSGINQVLGLVSYFYADPNQMAEGGSKLDNRFITLLDKVCSHKKDNC